MQRMHRTILLFLSLTFLGSPATLTAQSGDDALRAALVNAYNAWRDAVIRKDARAWAGAITRYRQTVVRNAIVSDRRVFPDAVFEIPVVPPAVEGLRLLEAQGVGPTAHLVYFGKIDMGQDKELLHDDILKLKFLRENGVWKYDSNRMTSLSNAPEVRKALQEGKRPDFLDLPEYTPPGSMPPPPPLCRVPDYRAGYKLQSVGCETTVSMNGFDFEPVQDTLDQGVIIGGLINGHNEVTLTIKKVPEAAKAIVQLRIYRLEGDSSKPGIEVLRWQSPESGVPGRITLPIEVKP